MPKKLAGHSLNLLDDDTGVTKQEDIINNIAEGASLINLIFKGETAHVGSEDTQLDESGINQAHVADACDSDRKSGGKSHENRQTDDVAAVSGTTKNKTAGKKKMLNIEGNGNIPLQKSSASKCIIRKLKKPSKAQFAKIPSAVMKRCEGDAVVAVNSRKLLVLRKLDKVNAPNLQVSGSKKSPKVSAPGDKSVKRSVNSNAKRFKARKASSHQKSSEDASKSEHNLIKYSVDSLRKESRLINSFKNARKVAEEKDLLRKVYGLRPVTTSTVKSSDEGDTCKSAMQLSVIKSVTPDISKDQKIISEIKKMLKVRKTVAVASGRRNTERSPEEWEKLILHYKTKYKRAMVTVGWLKHENCVLAKLVQKHRASQ